MLNFAEQTGSGAVIVVWSFLIGREKHKYINYIHCKMSIQLSPNSAISIKSTHPMTLVQEEQAPLADSLPDVDLTIQLNLPPEFLADC